MLALLKLRDWYRACCRRAELLSESGPPTTAQAETAAATEAHKIRKKWDDIKDVLERPIPEAGARMKIATDRCPLMFTPDKVMVFSEADFSKADKLHFNQNCSE